MFRFPFRGAALLALALLVPACGSDSSSSSVPSIPEFPIPPGPGPFTLKSDNWDSGQPSSNWIIVRAPATVDAGVGAPPASMVIGDATDGGEVRSFHKFDSGAANPMGSITVRMDVAFLSELPTIAIYDADQLPPSGTALAVATMFDDGIAYRVGNDLFQQNVINDGNWHTFEIKIGSGVGTWKRDGATQLVGSVTSGWIVIYIRSGSFVSVWIDNVAVTAP